jgi:hypothetical protein
LNLDAKVRREMDGVQDMPAVETEALLALVEAVGANHLGHAEVRRAVFGIATARDIEVPRAAKVVLGPGAADRREILVAIEVDLEFALAPPAGAVDAPREVGADVVAMTCDAIEENMGIAGAKRVGAAELSVKITQPGDIKIGLVR